MGACPDGCQLDASICDDQNACTDDICRCDGNSCVFDPKDYSLGSPSVLPAFWRLARAESSTTSRRGVVLSPPIIASEGS
jgi:hypothetical protein